eukprot:1137395-Pelagomonas_calceolata.AAC.2
MSSNGFAAFVCSLLHACVSGAGAPEQRGMSCKRPRLKMQGCGAPGAAFSAAGAPEQRCCTCSARCGRKESEGYTEEDLQPCALAGQVAERQGHSLMPTAAPDAGKGVTKDAQGKA